LQRFQHIPPKRQQHAPHKWTVPAFGQRLQMAPIDDAPKLDKQGIRLVQSIVGSLLYYARAVDPTMLPALNDIGSEQSAATTKTKESCKWLLDFATTYPNAKIRFHASDMQLYVDSDAAYLVQPNARSRYAGYFYLGKPRHDTTKINGAILVNCKTIRSVVASAAEAETAGLFYNAQDAIIIARALTELGHSQHAVWIKTDNTTANSFVHSNLKQRKSKTWDMRYNWLRDRSTKKEINIYWDRGSENTADYFTKHHAPSHHHRMRPEYILHGHHASQT
jgi:hypothetical protein